MTDHPEILSRYRLPWRRDQLKQGGKWSAAMRYGPGMLIGAAILGVAGFLAWKNRDKIAATAGPMIENAKARGQTLLEEARARSSTLIDEAKARSSTLIDEAKVKGEELIGQAKAKGEAVAEKVASSVRRGAADESLTSDLH
jgi:hypothetical protein